MEKKNIAGWRAVYRHLSISSRILILFLFAGIGFCIFLILFFIIPLYLNLDKASGSISFLDFTKQIKKEIKLDSCFIEGHFDRNGPRIVLKSKQDSTDAILSFTKKMSLVADEHVVSYFPTRIDVRTYASSSGYSWVRPDYLSLEKCHFEKGSVSAQMGFSRRSYRSLWDWLMNGNVRVLCELPEKEFVSVEATFKNCVSSPSVAF